MIETQASTARAGEVLATGRVLQVSVSAGGIPKLPVPNARVTRMGLEGDRHREDTVHGGPSRAVCLFGIEVIERLQSEGHPVEPGGVGENLTTSGIEWSTLPIGAVARVGESLVLEISKPAMPCATQRPNFIGGRFGRMSIEAHPSDSRMYGRVLAEGEVRAGDEIVVVAPLPDSSATDELLQDRVDDVERESNVRLWRAGAAAGLDVRIVDDGELAIAATPSAPGPQFNMANGLRQLPHKLERVLAHFRRAGCPGWFGYPEAPWPGAAADFEMRYFVADPSAVSASLPGRPAGIAVRRLGQNDLDVWVQASVALGSPYTREQVERYSAYLQAQSSVHALVLEEEGRVVAAGTLHRYRGMGLLRGGTVVAEARGRGLQRILIAERARLAAELGCRDLAASCIPGTASERNLAAAGMRAISTRSFYRFDP